MLAARGASEHTEDRMTSVRVPGFRPSTGGLHFPNAFPHVPNLEIDLPGGTTVPIGDAANGLCGGMAWTVRDLFETGLAPPAMTRGARRRPGVPLCRRPAPGQPLAAVLAGHLPQAHAPGPARRRPGHGPRPGLADDPAGVAGHPRRPGPRHPLPARPV